MTAADIDVVEGGVNEVGAITSAVHTQTGLRTVYYSVGTSGADFKNGSPMITISGGVATLTTSQPPNVGVGDEITYNGTSKVYISGRASGSVYTVTTATGNLPVDVTGQTVNSILRSALFQNSTTQGFGLLLKVVNQKRASRRAAHSLRSIDRKLKEKPTNCTVSGTIRWRRSAELCSDGRAGVFCCSCIW